MITRHPPLLHVFAESNPASGHDWKRQWREAVKDPRLLLEQLGLQSIATQLSDTASAQFPMRVPQSFVARMRHGDHNDPLLRQVLPITDEMQPAAGFSLDAVGDTAANLGHGVIHKYQGRALLVTTGSCAIHCRYCFRRHFPYAEQTSARHQWADAIELIRNDTSISEVLLSGGDPLSLATSKLAELTTQLKQIPHIRRLRIHTRLPVVLPDRVDDELLAWLRDLPWPLVIVVHANHANEFDSSVDHAMQLLRSTGAMLFNQAVLLKGVNDSAQALIDLCQRGFDAGVVPYYLHQLDRVSGAAHFEVPDAQAAMLYGEMRAHLPGYLLPKFVREVSGDRSKRPIDVPL